MAITSAQVGELRERSGAGIMDCKNALMQTNGDIESALEFLRKSGMAKANKKAGRVASEGTIKIKSDKEGHAAVIVEFNCETDFVAKDTHFTQFAEQTTALALQAKTTTVEALLATQSVEEQRKELVAKLGENIQIRRLQLMTTQNKLYSYSHGTRIGVILELVGGNEELGKDIAMHIAASNPQAIDPSGVAPEIIAKEREIYAAQAQGSGKPPEIIQKMVEGRLQKYLKEVTLLSQPFVKNPDQTVAQLLQALDAKVVKFVRYEVGEGIEKKAVNFAEEVMAQVRG